MKDVNTTHRLCQFIVKKYVKPTNIVWSREIKIAKKLVNTYANPAFWDWFSLDFPLNSLAYLLTNEGANRLIKASQLFSFEIPLPEKYNIGTEKVGEDAKIEKTSKTIFEFFKKTYGEN